MNCPEHRPNFKDITGMRFGRLKVLSFSYMNKFRRAAWKCECDCGTIKIIDGLHLRQGKILSCGCLHKEITIKASTVHGMHDTPPYNSWAGMLQRCENPNDPRYKDYGGRGIVVCDNWHDYQKFWNDMKGSYAEGLTIDRIDVNGNYCEENCKWSTQKEQANNRRNNHMLSFNGTTQTLAQWADALGINYDTLRYRIKRGWSVERALTTEVSA